MANKEDFEYLAESAKQDFQHNITALLEAHGDFLHKISIAKGGKKTGIWIELSEAEIISGHIFECVSNLAGDYKVIDITNKILNTNYKALQSITKRDLETTIQQFKDDKITKEEFEHRVNMFVGYRKPSTAA